MMLTGCTVEFRCWEFYGGLDMVLVIPRGVAIHSLCSAGVMC